MVRKKLSREHAPPKLFFPIDKRKNLITVDSCTEHNQDTSLDDQYVRNIITMMIDGNPTAYQQFSQRTLQSLSESSKLLNRTVEGQVPVNHDGVETVAIAIEKNRIDSVMRKIAYAVFLFKYKKRWLRRLIVVTTYLKTLSLEPDEFGELIDEIQKKHTPLYEGENPEVFQYAFFQTCSDFSNNILRMKFYGGFEVWIIPDNESEPELGSLY